MEAIEPSRKRLQVPGAWHGQERLGLEACTSSPDGSLSHCAGVDRFRWSSFPPDRRQDVDLHSLQHGVFPRLGGY